MSTTDNDLRSLAHQRGYRMTPQRQLILEAIRDAGEHADVNAIYESVRARSKAISLPTVYRTLDFLCELRLVVAMQIGRHIVYEIPGEHPHHHVICRKCGDVDIVTEEELQPLFAEIDRKHGFLVDMDHLGLFGLCKVCRPQAEA